ncbi:MAG TPA: DUF4932 domain-containing protein [Chitinophagaceae bacterium]|nr:DUF4932 domain-containing protein [Chitinophagaceae bacterium]
MKKLILVILPLYGCAAYTQLSEHISEKVSLSVNTNIETYYIAEKLAVEHIGNYVFSNKTTQFTHQPLVCYAQKEFTKWTNSPIILRIADILRQLRDKYHDNAQTLEYLLYRNEFPDTGYRWPPPATLHVFDTKESKALTLELSDSLASFYRQANVGSFLKRNASYYKGALAEARKHINRRAIPYMEKWYGHQFAAYELYLMPGMPITPGKDNYRAFGPMLISPKGEVSAMVFSSSIELPLEKSLKDYQHFGFDNADVIRFLTVHEIGHSFVNPVMKPMTADIQHDTSLFSPALAKALAPSYIDGWENCIIEHLVRLGEIRIAVAMDDTTEASRLRKLHINEFKFALLPLLEKKIVEYENDRSKYPNFNSFLPEIFDMFHNLKPEDVDKAVARAH